jgi:hypothetical protein
METPTSSINFLPPMRMYLPVPSVQAEKQARIISDNPLSNSCLALVRDWIRQCEENHIVCSSERLGEYPKRLLDVGEGDYIKLSLAESNQRYVALSHCWGNSAPLTTTKVNEVQHNFSIPCDSLPRSYRDAVKVTRWLGINHLWIDSLCILQDDPDDWEEKSAKMAGIYSGSYLVIAATRASSSDEGFLQTRDPCREIRSYDHFSSSGSVELLLSDCQLFKRGWCFQERMLASRVLHFAPQELIFHSRIGRKCECSIFDGSKGRRTQDSYYLAHLDPSISSFSDNVEARQNGSRAVVDRRAREGIRRRFRSFKAKIHDMYLRGKVNRESYDPSLKPIRFGEMWGYIIADYSPLEFTFDRDVLPALSGLVNLTQAFSPGCYIAGLWEKDLHYQLAWESIVDEADCSRPQEYLAPSFSWASRIGSVIFPYARIIKGLCAIVEAQATPKGADPFGRVKNGHLILRGKMISGHVHSSKCWWRVVNEEEEKGIFVFDTLQYEAEIGNGEVNCFELFRERRDHDSFEEVTALALRYNEINGLFSRVGLFRCCLCIGLRLKMKLRFELYDFS